MDGVEESRLQRETLIYWTVITQRSARSQGRGGRRETVGAARQYPY